MLAKVIIIHTPSFTIEINEVVLKIFGDIIFLVVLLSTVLFLSSSTANTSIDENNPGRKQRESNRFSIQLKQNSFIDQPNSQQSLHARSLNSRLISKINL